MRLICTSLAIAGFFILLYTGCHKSDSSNPVAPIDTTQDGPIARKPNLYIHTPTTQTVDVTLAFPLGGRLLDAVPPYGTSWHVTVDSNGAIDGQYRFLFYEAQTPDAYQYTAGWFVSRDTLESFFSQTMRVARFGDSEIVDFLDYWIPRLKGSEHFLVYPQMKTQLDKMIQVTIAPPPERFLRLFFVIQSADAAPQGLVKPEIGLFERSGYYAVEWGVVLK